jgi:hypothetical protein
VRCVQHHPVRLWAIGASFSTTFMGEDSDQLRKSRWNVVNETCWFQTPDQTVMLRWLIGTQLFWVLLMSTGEIVAFLVIVGYFISYEVRHLSIVNKPSPTLTFEARHTALSSPIGRQHGRIPGVLYAIRFPHFVVSEHNSSNWCGNSECQKPRLI